MANLLPTSHSEFTTKEYWDSFFKQRNQTAFEWYGSYPDVSPLVEKFLSKNDSILVVGCGNSDFSSELYDREFTQITNMDFSEIVIQEMQIKNIRRFNMKWDVGDMTNMKSLYNDQSFKVVVDKGALDALVSTNTTELKLKAKSMFEEINRVLNESGSYFCITLAEDFILSTLLDYFQNHQQNKWNLSVYPIFTSKRSPFLPFFFKIDKVSEASHEHSISIYCDPIGNSCEEAIKVNTAEQLQQHIAQIQQYRSMVYRMGELEIGRLEVIQLWSDAKKDSAAAQSASYDVPRFTIQVIDVSDRAAHSCVVFLVPLGHESNYQFTSRKGLIDIAFQANCRRLISVSCNKPHVFPDQLKLQEELNPIVLQLKLADMESAEQIPYMAVGGDDSWQVLEQGQSSFSGEFIVEEKELEDSNYLLRRLIFLVNQQFVQTEVRLHRSRAPDSWQVDCAYIDDHHQAVLTALALHTSLLPDRAAGHSALVVGLGGGALPSLLQRLLPRLQLTVVEIDAEIVRVAEKFFAFQRATTTEVRVEDGLEYLCRAQKESLDVIVYDVDGKDMSLGISAPPLDFITTDALHRAAEVLKSTGMLVINVVARSTAKFQDLVKKLQSIFPVVLSLQASEENINNELICLKSTALDAMAEKMKKPVASIFQLRLKSSQGNKQFHQLLNEWSENIKSEKDVIEDLHTLFDKIVVME